MSKSVFIYGDIGPHDNYPVALHAAGCTPYLSRDVSLSRDCDALLLPGGGDIGGKLGEEEYMLIKSFIDTGRPILGICRGMQALNVWFGGTLYEDIPHHRVTGCDMVHATRACDIIAELLGKAPVVNSNHHQALKEIGAGLKPIQWTEDGIIEAVCHESLPIWGVQWHPERQSFVQQRPDAVDAAPLFDFFSRQLR